MSTGSSSGPGGKLSIHSGSGTLRGGGVSKIYGNMAVSLTFHYHHLSKLINPKNTVTCFRFKDQ